MPSSIQKQAGIKTGDRLLFQAFPNTITITAVSRAYNPTKSELALIRKGEADIARGDFITLTYVALK